MKGVTRFLAYVDQSFDPEIVHEWFLEESEFFETREAAEKWAEKNCAGYLYAVVKEEI